MFARHHPDLAIFEPSSGTAVVVPSLTLPPGELGQIKGIRFYEERLLFLLLTLRNPAVSLVYLSSVPIHHEIIDYYLGFLPDPADARRRLHLISPDDPGSRPLTHKILDSPAIRREIARLGGRDAWLLPFVVSAHEEQLADVTGLPVYGPAASLDRLGTKSGCREVAEEAGVESVPGYGRLSAISEVEKAAWEIAADHGPIVLKLDDSYSGLGNAVIDELEPGTPLSEARIRFSAPGETWDSFAAKMAARGGIAERWLDADDLRMPSVLARITPGGTPWVVATHDQILDGTVYQGCGFPARGDYRFAVQDCAEQVMRVMARRGVIGLFGMDFFVTGGEVLLCEINLRLGGTTHPFGTALLATSATYDHLSGHLVADGRTKSYLATDNLVVPELRGRGPAEMIARLGPAAFDGSRRTGAILHMLGAAGAYGKVGFTAIGDSAAEAAEIYDAARAALT